MHEQLGMTSITTDILSSRTPLLHRIGLYIKQHVRASLLSHSRSW